MNNTNNKRRTRTKVVVVVEDAQKTIKSKLVGVVHDDALDIVVIIILTVIILSLVSFQQKIKLSFPFFRR